LIKTNANANICAGAAVLAGYRAPSVASASDVSSWTAAVTRFGATGSGRSNATFAAQVFTVLRDGATRVTSDGQQVKLAAEPSARVPAVPAAAARTDCPARLACDWVPAPYLKGDPSLPDDTGDYGNHDLADRTGPGGPELDYIVIHDTEGSYDSALNLVQDPTYLAWNYTVRSSDGQVAQHLNAKDVGWHAGNWYLNMHSIGIEHEGKAGTNGWFTEAMYQSSATLVTYLARKYDIPLDPAHIIGHDQIPGILPGYTVGVHWDPGPYWDWGTTSTCSAHPSAAGRAPPASWRSATWSPSVLATPATPTPSPGARSSPRVLVPARPVRRRTSPCSGRRRVRPRRWPPMSARIRAGQPRAPPA